MKRLKYIISAFALSLILSGCGQSQPEVYVNPEFVGAPSWVQVPTSVGKIAEMGSAPKNSMNNFGFQRELAMSNARTNLAKKLNIKVKSMFKTFSSQTSANNGTFDMTAESVSKQITKQSLSGTSQEAAWTSRSGTLYVLMTIDTKTISDLMEKNAKSSYKNDEAAYQKFQAAKAQGELDKALEKN
ncbi:MAG: LPP20 family lipoprotein [Arcobacteraceae bacterium]|nr:LPP20 family lipoprotein [Arcobacteraceae bacterium]